MGSLVDNDPTLECSIAKLFTTLLISYEMIQEIIEHLHTVLFNEFRKAV
jgi:hypothetical protein